MGTNTNALEHTVGFYKSLWHFVAIIVFAAPLFALSEFVDARLIVEWRRWLCKELLVSYFSDRSFFKLKQQQGGIDNPDQVTPHRSPNAYWLSTPTSHLLYHKTIPIPHSCRISGFRGRFEVYPSDASSASAPNCEWLNAIRLARL